MPVHYSSPRGNANEKTGRALETRPALRPGTKSGNGTFRPYGGIFLRRTPANLFGDKDFIRKRDGFCGNNLAGSGGQALQNHLAAVESLDAEPTAFDFQNFTYREDWPAVRDCRQKLTKCPGATFWQFGKQL